MASSRSARMARKMAAYSSAAAAWAIPICVVWEWMMAAPSSRQRRASSATAAGVSATSGLRSLVVTPLTATSMMTGWSVVMSTRNVAAIGDEYLAGDEAGRVRGQEQRRPDHLLGVGHALHEVHLRRPH